MKNWNELGWAGQIAALTDVLDLIWTLPEASCNLDTWASTPDDMSVDENVCGTTFCMAGWLAHDKKRAKIWDLALRPVRTYKDVYNCVTDKWEEETRVSFRLDRFDPVGLTYDSEGFVEHNGPYYRWMTTDDILPDANMSCFLFGTADLAEGADRPVSQRDEMIFRILAATAFIYLQEHGWNADDFKHVGLVFDKEWEEGDEEYYGSKLSWFADTYQEQLLGRVEFMKSIYDQQGK